MQYALLTLIALLFSSKIAAQYSDLGAEAFGQANSLVASANSSSVYNNPAGLPFFDKNFIGIGYQQVFKLAGLGTSGVYGNYKTKIAHIGFSADKFGDKLYHETRLGLAVAKKLDKISFGLKFSYLYNGIKDFSSKSTLLSEFGIMTQLSKKFMFGMHVINFTRAKLYDSQYLPTVISIGLSFKPSNQVTVTSQLDYTISQKPSVRAGMAYQLHDDFLFNIGVDPARNAVSCGLGYHIKRYQINYAVSSVSPTGLANQLSLMFYSQKK